jgi:hypothetical protein
MARKSERLQRTAERGPIRSSSGETVSWLRGFWGCRTNLDPAHRRRMMSISGRVSWQSLNCPRQRDKPSGMVLLWLRPRIVRFTRFGACSARKGFACNDNDLGASVPTKNCSQGGGHCRLVFESARECFARRQFSKHLSFAPSD